MWSVGSGKMLGIPSLNTDPTTNKFCQGMYNSKKENLICRECYSMSMLNTFRKNCKPKFLNNSKFLSEKVLSLKVNNKTLLNLFELLRPLHSLLLKQEL